MDFDFFAFQEFDTAAIHRLTPFLAESEIVQQAPNTLTCLVDRGEVVKVSFFGLPLIRPTHPPLLSDNGLKVASLVDLAGMKAAVVQRRPEAKDYIDIDALMRHGITLETALAAGQAIYGSAFNPQITLKALSYFDEGDLGTLPDALKQRIVRAVAKVDLGRLPDLDGDWDR